MSFYLRKSVAVGPLRFNLSGSGIGVSAGVKGLRVGTGPHGNYVHMGRGGFYYRKTLAADVSPTLPSSPAPALSPTGPDVIPDSLTPIESGDVATMTDSSSEELLSELREKQKRWRLWPFVAFGGIAAGALVVLPATTALAVYLQGRVSAWILTALVALTLSAASIGIVVASILVARRDRLRKTVVLLYNFDPELEQAYAALHTGFEWLATSQRTWRVTAQGRTSDWKHNAGATQLNSRSAVSPNQKATPPFLQTNIAVPALPLAGQTLYFFPDRVVIYSGSQVGAVSYDQLKLEVSTANFIESESVARDATHIGTTWQYVNKSGGPDRRFKSNRQLPRLRYGTLHLTSPTGLNVLFHLSRESAPENFAQGVKVLASALAAAPAG
jgi:hypothetical protein